MRVLTFAFLVLLTTGCAQNMVKSDLAPTPKVVSVTYKVYVPIPDELLELCEWRATAPPSLALEVARERKACLRKYEAQLKSIGIIRMKPVEEITSGK